MKTRQVFFGYLPGVSEPWNHKSCLPADFLCSVLHYYIARHLLHTSCDSAAYIIALQRKQRHYGNIMLSHLALID